MNLNEIIDREVTKVLNAADNYDNEEMARAACFAVAQAVVEECAQKALDCAEAWEPNGTNGEGDACRDCAGAIRTLLSPPEPAGGKP